MHTFFLLELLVVSYLTEHKDICNRHTHAQRGAFEHACELDAGHIQMPQGH